MLLTGYTGDMRRRNIVLLLTLIILLGAFFRFFRITTVPPGLYPDEAANGNNALEALSHTNFSAEGGRAFGGKIFYPENNGREGLFINIQALSLWIFGNQPWALRLISALFGTLTILGVYLVTKELFYERKLETRSSKFETNSKIQNTNDLRTDSDPNFRNLNLFRASDFGFRISRGDFIGLLAAFFLATSYWHINFSRIGFRAISVPLFASFGAYWLLKALRTGKQSSAIMGGIATGLGFHTYIAFRFIPFVFAIPIIGAFVSWIRGRVRDICLPCVIALYLFVTVIVAIPIGLYFFENPEDFLGRSGQVSIFSSEKPLYEFAKSTALTFGMLNVRGDCNARHNFNCQPELFWPVGILFLVGFVVMVRSLLKPGSTGAWFLTLWFLVMMLPATLTREGLPHALRAIGMIVPTFVIAGLGGAWLWGAIGSLLDRAAANQTFAQFQTQLLRIRREIGVIAILAIALIPVSTYYVYFNQFAEGKDTYGAFSLDLWHEGQFLASLPVETQKIVVVNLSGDDIRGVPAPAQTIMFATNSFGLEERKAKHITYVTSADAISFDPTRKVMIVFMNGADKNMVASVRARFPDLKPFVPWDFLTLEN